MIVQDDLIQQSCLDELSKHSTSFSPLELEVLNQSEFPTLPPLNHFQVKKLQKLTSQNKGITFDGFSDTWFKQNKNTSLLKNWWNQSLISKLSKLIFEARLIPLNKVYPNIPTQSQFRPIVILSAGYKWEECRFLPSIKAYLSKRLNINQTGFVAGCQT